VKATIAGLFVYPVKSCGGIAMREARLTERGLEGDRHWMVVDAEGRFISQREAPRLALVSVASSTTGLQLRAPGMSALDVPFETRGPSRIVSVWRDSVAAVDGGDIAAGWLSALIAREARLVRFDAHHRRPCNPAFVGASGAHTAFADAYPLLVIAQASLADLNHRLSSPLPMNRFRPNVVLSGIEAYDEDHIEEIRAGEVVLKLVKACTRCRVTTTDQETAEVGVEPLQTLSSYRHNSVLDGVTFGMNAIVTNGAGLSLSVGTSANCVLNF